MTTNQLRNAITDLRLRMQRYKSTEVSAASGVHINSVRALRNGVATNPTICTLIAVSKALDSLEESKND